MATQVPHYITSLRVPAELREWAAEQAHSQRLSFNAFILSLMEKAREASNTNAQ